MLARGSLRLSALVADETHILGHGVKSGNHACKSEDGVKTATFADFYPEDGKWSETPSGARPI